MQILDFACYNAVEDNSIHLNSNKTIEINQLEKPLFVVCNYLFDTLPHDAFQIIDGNLYETEISIQHKKKSKQKKVEDYFSNVSYKFKQNLIDANYYDDQDINSILSFYQDYFENASFLIPLGGIQFLSNIRRFTKSHIVLLLADKGVAKLELFDELGDPDISLHGSVSMNVNVDALARYVEYNKGTSLLMNNKSADFQIGCFILNSTFQITNTKFTFNSILSSFSLFDLFNICYKKDLPNKAFKSLEDLLAVLNLAEWDPTIFYDYHQLLLKYLEKEDLTAEQQDNIRTGLYKVWDYFFKLEKEQDIAFSIGIIFYTIDNFEEALEFYQHSLKYFGEQEETLYNIALVYQSLEEAEQARAWVEKIIKINPAYEPAKELLAE